MSSKDGEPIPRKIDTQGRVRLPPEVKAALGVADEEHIAFIVQGGRVEVKAIEWRVKERP